MKQLNVDLTRRLTRGYSPRPDKDVSAVEQSVRDDTGKCENPACGNNFILQRRDCF